ncbi:hypothetical protein J6590_010137 [Homalodisca vitripennis]|nr:hypothetical protein J6590_010137 [Homalodisca vitripennis]
MTPDGSILSGLTSPNCRESRRLIGDCPSDRRVTGANRESGSPRSDTRSGDIRRGRELKEYKNAGKCASYHLLLKHNEH